jgi:hypothetical protein
MMPIPRDYFSRKRFEPPGKLSKCLANFGGRSSERDVMRTEKAFGKHVYLNIVSGS